MADTSLFHSPFEGHALGDRPTRAGAIEVEVRARRLDSVVLVSTWPAGIQLLCEKLGPSLGVDLPARTGLMARSAAGMVMRTGPEEYMLVSQFSDEVSRDMAEFLQKSIPADMGSVTDLSHARCCIHIQGSKCLESLGKLFALDFREEEFPVNEFRLSGHHHVPCTLQRLGHDEFNLIVFSTYANGQLGTLLDAALEYGLRLTSPR